MGLIPAVLSLSLSLSAIHMSIFSHAIRALFIGYSVFILSFSACPQGSRHRSTPATHCAGSSVCPCVRCIKCEGPMWCARSMANYCEGSSSLSFFSFINTFRGGDLTDRLDSLLNFSSTLPHFRCTELWSKAAIVCTTNISVPPHLSGTLVCPKIRQHRGHSSSQTQSDRSDICDRGLTPFACALQASRTLSIVWITASRLRRHKRRNIIIRHEERQSMCTVHGLAPLHSRTTFFVLFDSRHNHCHSLSNTPRSHTILHAISTLTRTRQKST